MKEGRSSVKARGLSRGDATPVSHTCAHQHTRTHNRDRLSGEGATPTALINAASEGLRTIHNRWWGERGFLKRL